MNNVGEAFFSAPSDPNALMKDWGRSDDDQRHRLVLSGSVNSPSAPGTTMWEHLSHGFQASGMLQYYSALPFNIVTGVNSLQGTAGRPFADGSGAVANFDIRTANLIPRNVGAGNDFFTMSLRVRRALQFGGGRRTEGMFEVFNVTNRANPVAGNTPVGAGS